MSNKITARGIYHDINDSSYSLTVDDFTFYFSSLFYLRKFNECKNTTDLYLIRIIRNLDLYKSIEKRGARILFKGAEYNCVETLLSESVKGIEMNLGKSIKPYTTVKADYEKNTV